MDKRIETGEVVTAQHWKNGHETIFKRNEANKSCTFIKEIQLLRPLLSMLKRMEMEPITP